MRRLGNAFKSLMREVPHALTIISAPTAEENTKPKGLLVSSFNSVTVFPIPYVSFNIKVPSSTLSAIDTTRHFTASVVDNSITADVFAQIIHKYGHLWEEILEADGRLKEGFGGVAWMKCKLPRDKRVEIGDHAIVVGEVLDCASYADRGSADAAMVYWQGKYARIGRGTILTEPGTGVTVRSGDTMGLEKIQKSRRRDQFFELDEDGLGREEPRAPVRKFVSDFDGSKFY